MPAFEVSIAAATAVVGYNLLSSSPHRQLRRGRVIKAIACRGSAAAGDTEIALLKGTDEIARVFNTTTGFPNRDDLKAVNVTLGGNEELSAIVIDAPATNPINVLIETT